MDDNSIAPRSVPEAVDSSEERRDNPTLKPLPVHVGEGSNGIDPVVEKRLRRKLDLRVVSLLFILYLLAFLDRSNIGNAQTAGMGEELMFGDEQFQVRAMNLGAVFGETDQSSGFSPSFTSLTV